jgi:hypothetical protein
VKTQTASVLFSVTTRVYCQAKAAGVKVTSEDRAKIIRVQNVLKTMGGRNLRRVAEAGCQDSLQHAVCV